MLHLFNTLSQKQEPIKNKKIKCYACGPTVYDYAHIGNFRSFIAEDVIRRYMIFKGINVKFIMNITDVGHLTSDSDTGKDKILIGAENLKKSVKEVIDFYSNAFMQDMVKLRIMKPNSMPKASDHIKEMIKMIKSLEKLGYTYIIRDGIYFDTSKLNDYGKFNRNIEGLKPGKRVRIGEKKSHTDFALWKFSPKGEKRQMEWNSPWGKGFPGWHIECSAMVMKYLGNSIDLHFGGVDHIPIHHTNEIAQSESITRKPLSKIWSHVEFMKVNGSKMSKSLKNTYTINDLEKKGFDPVSFRYLCLSTHYRSQMNFTFDALKDAQNTAKSINNFVSKLKQFNGKGKDAEIEKILKKTQKEFEKHMDNDIGTPNAISSIFELMRFVNKKIDSKGFKNSVKNVLKFMISIDKIFCILNDDDIPKTYMNLIKKREKLRKENKFDEADEIRYKLEKKGIFLKDTSKGSIYEKRKT